MNSSFASFRCALRDTVLAGELGARRVSKKYDLTRKQLLVLQLLLERGDMFVSDISQLTGLKPSSVTALINRLVVKKLVKRRRSPIDKRRVAIELLILGQSVARKASDEIDLMCKPGFEALQTWEQAMLVSSIERSATLLRSETRFLDSDRG